MTSYGRDWQPVDGLVTAWFEATSLAQGVALAARVLEADPEALVDVRAAGVRVRLTTQEHAAAVSAAATEAVPDRAAAIIAAGGRLIEETTTQSRFADPEGNELVLIGG